MATELIKKEVDGHNYEFEQFGARLSLKTLMRLAKIVGQPFVMSMSSYQGKGKPLNTQSLAEAAALLFKSLEEQEAISLIELLSAEKVLCDGKIVKFDDHYAGNLTHLFKVLSAALEVQYGNFFDALSEYLNSGNLAQQVSTQASLT